MQTFKNILIAFFLIVIIVGYDIAHTDKAKAVSVPQVTPQATPHGVEVHYPPIEEYIRLKFGVYADNAMRLLTDPACAENRHLDPLAVNDNRSWGGIGRDRGIFQINDVFHPLTDAQAFDYKQNIDYAFRMFENDGHTFKRWTCGKYLGL
jgi:hypothetical protein